MARRRIALDGNARRSILTDMLPFEVPPTFSNRGFYSFLHKYQVEVDSGRVRWCCSSDEIDRLMKLIFNVEESAQIDASEVELWGGTKEVRSFEIKTRNLESIPFQFNVSHGDGSRVLSVAHPKNQIDVACFYEEYGSLVLYYTSLSKFSIRKPVRVAKYAYFDDKLHQRLFDVDQGIEEEGREYEQLGSFFSYKQFQNIHRFFESEIYHRCERKYDSMMQVDIGKCFDSIYTHSVVWAVLGKAQTKFNLEESKQTFAGRFDALMQNLNHKETNGILIGPEFSRIFAEVILQSIDRDLESRLRARGCLLGRDYEIFRYVDDYFAFASKESVQLLILEELQVLLREKKLSINPAKIRRYSRPVITELTIAKDRVQALLTEAIAPALEEVLVDAGVERRFSCAIRADLLIVRYKTLVKESGVEYASLLNFTLAILERKLDRIVRLYRRSDRAGRDEERLVQAILGQLEFAFFVFSGSPKVNHSVRLCRLVSTSVDLLREMRVSHDAKHVVLRYIHDSIMEQLQKNEMTVHREVESLYLLVSLLHLGREYWLPESLLVKHFLIKVNVEGEYVRDGFLGHFAITVLLSYMKDKKRYSKLRAFIAKHALEKIRYVESHCPNHSEALILFLDVISCPFLTQVQKDAVAQSFDLTAGELVQMQSVRPFWFTAWGKHFSLTRELEAKRSREVY